MVMPTVTQVRRSDWGDCRAPPHPVGCLGEWRGWPGILAEYWGPWKVKAVVGRSGGGWDLGLTTPSDRTFILFLGDLICSTLLLSCKVKPNSLIR